MEIRRRTRSVRTTGRRPARRPPTTQWAAPGRCVAGGGVRGQERTSCRVGQPAGDLEGLFAARRAEANALGAAPRSVFKSWSRKPAVWASRLHVTVRSRVRRAAVMEFVAREILAWLGYPDEEIERLCSVGAVVGPAKGARA